MQRTPLTFHGVGVPQIKEVFAWFDIRFFWLDFQQSADVCWEYQVPAGRPHLQTALKYIYQWFRHSTCRDLKDSEGKVQGPVGCLKGNSAVRPVHGRLTIFSESDNMIPGCSGEYWSFRKRYFQVWAKFILHAFVHVSSGLLVQG